VDRRWLAGPVPSPYAELRLFCLPYAGSGAVVYRDWPSVVPERVQVCPIELPGRGSRNGEAAFTRLAPLANALAKALEGALDRPFALFGHSMGGLVAYELARTLRRAGGPQPVHLFVSATAAPGTAPAQPLVHCAAERDVKHRLRELNGTPREVLENEELMELMLPTIRADFAVLETYQYREEPPLPVPITVFGGTQDRAVPLANLNGWRGHSAVGCRLRLFPGDHFFLHSAAAEVIHAVSQILRPTTRPPTTVPGPSQVA
jgi:surfactin synthase thioesterase subunit